MYAEDKAATSLSESSKFIQQTLSVRRGLGARIELGFLPPEAPCWAHGAVVTQN